MELNVYFESDINGTSLKRFYEKVVPKLSEATRLNLYINSSGGTVAIALALARFIEKLQGEVWTYNAGHCDSAAVVLFAAGRVRVVNGRQSSFFVHEVRKEVQGLHSIKTLESELKILRRDTRDITSFLERCTKRKQGLWERDMKKGIVFTGERAVRTRLATKRMEFSVYDMENLIKI